MRKLALAVAVASVLVLLPVGAASAVPQGRRGTFLADDKCEVYGQSGRAICAQLRGTDSPPFEALAFGRVTNTQNGDIWRFVWVRLFRNGSQVRSASSGWMSAPEFKFGANGFNMCDRPGDYQVKARVQISGFGANGHEQTVVGRVVHQGPISSC